jgi:hypothetical protein
MSLIQPSLPKEPETISWEFDIPPNADLQQRESATASEEESETREESSVETPSLSKRLSQPDKIISDIDDTASVLDYEPNSPTISNTPSINISPSVSANIPSSPSLCSMPDLETDSSQSDSETFHTPVAGTFQETRSETESEAPPAAPVKRRTRAASGAQKARVSASPMLTRRRRCISLAAGEEQPLIELPTRTVKPRPIAEALPTPGPICKRQRYRAVYKPAKKTSKLSRLLFGEEVVIPQFVPIDEEGNIIPQDPPAESTSKGKSSKKLLKVPKAGKSPQ